MTVEFCIVCSSLGLSNNHFSTSEMKNKNLIYSLS
jgi:hypothetical protein